VDTSGSGNSPDDGEYLKYDTSMSPPQWVPRPISLALNDLSDVDIGGALADGDVLTYDTSSPTGWKAQAPTGGSSITAKDEGSTLTSAMTSVDFVGAGVTATSSGAAVTVTIPGAISGAAAFKGALVKKAADQTAANYTALTAIAWDSEAYDTDGFHDNATNNTRLTVPAGVGYVRLSGSVAISSITTGVYVITTLTKNGSEDFAGHGGQTEQSGLSDRTVSFQSPVLAVSAGDYFEFKIVLQTDTSVTINAARSWFAMEVIQPAFATIESHTFTGSTTSKTFSSIPATYTHLRLELLIRSSASATDTLLQLKINGDGTAGNYNWQQGYDGTNTVAASASFGSTGYLKVGDVAADTATADYFTAVTIDIPWYALTTAKKQVDAVATLLRAESSGNIFRQRFGGWWESTAAITSLEVLVTSGNIKSGSYARLIGIS
jgi:hypothetical protein